MTQFTQSAYKITAKDLDGNVVDTQAVVIDDTSDNVVVPLSYVDVDGSPMSDQFDGPAYNLSTWADDLNGVSVVSSQLTFDL